MNIKRTVCRERKSFTCTHTHLFEPSMGAFHDLRDDAKHHRTADIGDHGIMNDAIVDLCIRGNEKAAALAWTIAQNKINDLLLPRLLIGFEFHVDGVVIKNNRLDHCCQVHEEAA